MDEDVQREIEAFTCAMYGYPRETSVNMTRAKMLRKMVGEDETLSMKSKVDLARLPPCQDSLVPHVQRVNHRLACYRRASLPIFERPKPHENNQGWLKTDKGALEPVWSNGPILPLLLVDILAVDNDNESDEEESEEGDAESESDSDDDDI